MICSEAKPVERPHGPTDPDSGAYWLGAHLAVPCGYPPLWALESWTNLGTITVMDTIFLRKVRGGWREGVFQIKWRDFKALLRQDRQFLQHLGGCGVLYFSSSTSGLMFSTWMIYRSQGVPTRQLTVVRLGQGLWECSGIRISAACTTEGPRRTRLLLGKDLLETLNLVGLLSERFSERPV